MEKENDNVEKGGMDTSSVTKFRSLNVFPTELVLMIMNTVDCKYDRLNLSMICKYLLEIFNKEQHFHAHKLIKITKENHDDFLNLINSKDRFIKIIPNIEFHECSKLLSEDFWKEFGRYVLSLSFLSCANFYEIEQDFIYLILSYCANLESLDLSDTPVIWPDIINKCSQLKYDHLKVLKFTKLSNFAFNNFVLNSPKLNYLDFELPEELPGDELDIKPYEKIKDEEGKIRFAYEYQDSDYTDLTLKNIMQVLPTTNIKSIRTSNINDFQAALIIKLKDYGFELEEWSNYDSIKFIDQNFKINRLLNTYKNTIKTLDFSLSQQKNRFDSIFGINQLINLKTLKMPTDLHQGNMNEIKHLINLENLYFGFGSKHNYPGPPMLPSTLEQLPSLRRLYIHGSNVRSLELFLNNTTASLIELSVISCIHLDVRKCVDVLCKKHTELRELHINDCQVVNRDICEFKKKIRQRKRTRGRRPTATIVHNGIGTLRNIESLSMACSYINDTTIEEEFKWDKLEKLYIDKNRNLTDAALLSLSVNCPNIAELDLSGCRWITDKGIEYLCNLRRLRNIDLTGTSVTEVGVNYLVESLCPIPKHRIKMDTPGVKKRYELKPFMIPPSSMYLLPLEDFYL